MSRTTEFSDQAPQDKPGVARMYDYFLGGYHNFAIDRQAAEQVIAIYPDMPLVAQANRGFLRRAVQFLVAQGIEQLLDIGSGIPTVGNVHEVAQRANPAARVVYVDSDAVAVAHSEAILRGNAHATAIRADARRPEQILDHPEVRRLLDFRQSVAVLLAAVLHFVTDDEEAYRLVRVLREALAPGSYLAISHGTDENVPPAISAQLARLYVRTTNPARVRSRDEIERFFAGLELVEPGLVYVPLWRPTAADDLFLAQPERSVHYGGVGRKR